VVPEPTRPGPPASVLDVEPMPVAVLKDAELRNNIRVFSQYCGSRGVVLAPHVKTTMSREIFEMQRDAGAWAATVANVPQARTARAWGVERLVIASQVADAASMRWIVEQIEAAGELEIYIWIDSAEGLELATSVHEDAGATRPLRALVEIGHLGGRTGCRTTEEARELALRVARAERILLCGVSGFEGTITAESPDATRTAVKAFLKMMREVFDSLCAAEAFEQDPPLLSAGGSAYFDVVTQVFSGASSAQTLLRSGCYVTHDCGVYDELSPLGGNSGTLQAALEVWGSVLSVPEPSLALVGIGKRDASHDAGLPVPRKWKRRNSDLEGIPAGVRIFALNDQHAYVRDPSERLAVGDLVGCCISHPCTTFDKWRTLYVVDDAYGCLQEISTSF
jgi:D-serine dehydratase